MNNSIALLDTLLQQAETAAQRHSQHSRLAKQHISRKLERTDYDTVVQKLDAIYQHRPSYLPDFWRVAQQQTLYKKPKSWK